MSYGHGYRYRDYSFKELFSGSDQWFIQDPLAGFAVGVRNFASRGNRDYLRAQLLARADDVRGGTEWRVVIILVSSSLVELHTEYWEGSFLAGVLRDSEDFQEIRDTLEVWSIYDPKHLKETILDGTCKIDPSCKLCRLCLFPRTLRLKVLAAGPAALLPLLKSEHPYVREGAMKLLSEVQEAPRRVA
jgi:hypothetical protein